jgi:putative membrane protein
MFEWKNVFRGLLMGTSDAIPGVSGGTIAVILGIYDRLIEAINGIFSKNWRKHLEFLIPLGIGVGAAILAFSHVITWLLLHYPNQTNFFFMGLIIGVLPFLFNQADMKTTFKGSHYILLIIAIVLIGSLAFFKEPDADLLLDTTKSSVLLGLFFSGFIASMAMILPGISGSFILYLIGSYATVMHAVKSMDVSVIAIVLAGAAIGIVLCSKIIRYFLSTFPSYTFAIIIGMVIGSVAVIFPGFESDVTMSLLSIGAFALGLGAAVTLGRFEYK